MREQMGFLEQPFRITEKDKKLPLSVSPSTRTSVRIDRLLKQDKKKLSLKGKTGTKPGKHLKKQIPVRTCYADKKPCFFEIDTVHHCGISDSGECGLQSDASPLPPLTFIQAGSNCARPSTRPISSPAGHQIFPPFPPYRH
jgi:hypothetical protein